MVNDNPAPDPPDATSLSALSHRGRTKSPPLVRCRLHLARAHLLCDMLKISSLGIDRRLEIALDLLCAELKVAAAKLDEIEFAQRAVHVG